MIGQRFYEIIANLNINKLKPQGKYDWYSISSQGGEVSYDIKDRDKYILDNKGDVLKVDNEQLPITGHFISLYGMYKLNEISHEGRGYKDYFFDIMKK